MRLLWLFLALFMTAGVATAREQKTDLNQVVLLVRDSSPSMPSNPETIIRAVNAEKADGAQYSIRSALGTPKRASYAITSNRLAPQVLAKVSRDSATYRLHRYIVLEYGDVASARRAADLLSAREDVQSAEMNRAVELSSPWVPNDPHLLLAPPPPGFPQPAHLRQWGIQHLSFPDAWALTRGWGYVGVADSGIQMTHPDLQNAFRPHFARDFVNGGGNVDEMPPTPPDRNVRGHGTHVAGIIAATTNNNTGVAGACPDCSLMTGKVAEYAWNDPFVAMQKGLTAVKLADGIALGAWTGAQVINLSLGSRDSVNPCMDSLVCDAITEANDRQVVLVAAAGNHRCPNKIQTPARDARTIAVGGIDVVGGIWDELGLAADCHNVIAGSNEGPEMATHGVVAPAKSILSTFYAGGTWNVADGCPGNTNPGAAYDTCTGTSMAAPFITGLVALMRSTNPLLSVNDIKSHLFAASSLAGSPNNSMGHGVPNAATAVSSALATANQLTPLFSFHSPTAGNHFYTAVPQMATSAANGQIIPNGGYTGHLYFTEGTGILGYGLFPGDWTSQSPKAQVWVFTTPSNPFGGAPLVPLIRLSYECNPPLLKQVCTSNPNHVDHAYLTNPAEIASWQASGYRVDGIEGFVYPSNLSPQPGMVALSRRQHLSYEDTVIYPATMDTSMHNLGYQAVFHGTLSLGWVYPNPGYRPSY